MKLSTVLLSSVIACPVMGFSMLTHYDFPRRFETMMQDLEDMFEKDWPTQFLEQEMEDRRPTFRRASPRYEVTNDSEKFKLVLEVPDFKPEEIEVDLKAGGRMLQISGFHQVEEEDRSMTSKFQQNFSLDPSILTDKMTADFHDGKLVVTAPRLLELPGNRKIDVKQIEGKKETEEKQVKKDKTEMAP